MNMQIKEASKLVIEIVKNSFKWISTVILTRSATLTRCFISEGVIGCYWADISIPD